MGKNSKNKNNKPSSNSSIQNSKEEEEIVSLALATSSNQINECNLDGAIQTLSEALQSFPYSVLLLDSMSELLLQNNNSEAAKALIEQALSLDPQGNYKRWLTYAQFLTDKEALDALNKGIFLLQELVKNNKSVELHEELAKAYCSIAELYMTDLW